VPSGRKGYWVGDASRADGPRISNFLSNNILAPASRICALYSPIISKESIRMVYPFKGCLVRLVGASQLYQRADNDPTYSMAPRIPKNCTECSSLSRRGNTNFGRLSICMPSRVSMMHETNSLCATTILFWWLFCFQWLMVWLHSVDGGCTQAANESEFFDVELTTLKLPLSAFLPPKLT
jgi:hypothetical protein